MITPKIQQKGTGLYSIKEYLHEKAEESRHNETTAYLMFIAGAVFFVGGLLSTLHIGDNIRWFIFLPYNLASQPASFLGLTLTFSGMGLSVYGLVVGISYSRKRSFYIEQLCQAHAFVEKSIKNTPKRKKLRKTNNNAHKTLKKTSAT